MENDQLCAPALCKRKVFRFRAQTQTTETKNLKKNQVNQIKIVYFFWRFPPE